MVLVAEEVSDLREDWMRHTDQVLADEQIVAAVYDALAKRHPKNRGRLGTPAEVVLRLLILKHIHNWSYMPRSSAKCALTSCTGTSPAWAHPTCPTPRLWALGRGSRAICAQTDSRADGENRQGQGHHYGTANARGYDSGGDQHPPSNR